MFVLFCFSINFVKSARILGFFTVPSISHQQSFQSICKALALKGHEVTFITTDSLNDRSIGNLTEIDISQLYDILKTIDFRSSLSRGSDMSTRILGYFDLMGVLAHRALKDWKVQQLISGDEEFDILIM